MRPDLKKEQQISWGVLAAGLIAAVIAWWWLSDDGGLGESYEREQRAYLGESAHKIYSAFSVNSN